MIAATVPSDSWPTRRWVTAIVMVMAGQVGLIFWLARHSPTPLPPTPSVPKVYLTLNTGFSRADVIDPTMFVLPNINGFSGKAWMKTSPLEYQSLEWTEPPRPLTLSPEKLGSALAQFAGTNFAESFELSEKPEPALDLLSTAPEPVPTHSTLTVEGGLAHRPLLSKFKLSSWPAPDVLSNSVVQVAVDADGSVFSAVLVNPPDELSESRAANAAALSLARTAQFEPLPHNDTQARGRFQWGQLVFRWHTIPPRATNSTVVNPSP